MSNNQPISLTSIAWEIFESVVTTNIQEHLKNNLINFLHGFSKDESSITKVNISKGRSSNNKGGSPGEITNPKNKGQLSTAPK